MSDQGNVLFNAPSFLQDLIKLSTPAPLEVDVRASEEPAAMGIFDTIALATPVFGGVASSLNTTMIPFYAGIGATSILSAVAAQDIARKVDISTRDYPSVWFVNFPTNMTGDQRQEIKRYQQNMTDFRCWSSLKWWQEVYRLIPQGSGIDFQMMQGRLFAQMACQDMVKMSWLQTIRPPQEVPNGFEGRLGDLHPDIILRTVSDMVGDPALAAAAVEPVLQSIVNSVSTGAQMGHQLKTIITEKYEYLGGTDNFRSYVRMLCFEMSEGMYDVKTGKDSSERRIRVNFSFIQYEAIFNMLAWEQFSASIQQHEKEAMKDFVDRQTYDIPV